MSSNLLQMIFDGIWETGEIIVNSFKNKEPEEKKEPLDIFFLKVGLCNKDNEYPRVIETVKENDLDSYKIECPIGLGKSDFTKYEDALEVFLGRQIEIYSSKGYIHIK